jgi:hypothetical protein
VVLTSRGPRDTNTLGDPTRVVPAIDAVTGVRPSFSYSLPAYSITVLQLETGGL